VKWEFFKNEKRKNIQPKVVQNNQYFSLFSIKKVEIQNCDILLLKVDQHLNLDWNGNATLSRISGVVPNLINVTYGHYNF